MKGRTVENQKYEEGEWVLLNTETCPKRARILQVVDDKLLLRVDADTRTMVHRDSVTRLNGE